MDKQTTRTSVDELDKEGGWLKRHWTETTVWTELMPLDKLQVELEAADADIVAAQAKRDRIAAALESIQEK